MVANPLSEASGYLPDVFVTNAAQYTSNNYSLARLTYRDANAATTTMQTNSKISKRLDAEGQRATCKLTFAAS